MRRIWLIFKLSETMCGLSCLGYHASGYLTMDYVQSHYVYCAVFGGFTLMAMFGSISICLNDKVDALGEAMTNMIASILMVSISLDSMYHSEKDFYLTYLAADADYDDTGDPLSGIYQDTKFSFFKYSKGQSIAALCGGCFFFLHSVLAFDIALEDEEEDDIDRDDKMPTRLKLYVGGRLVHEWLENNYEWFRNMSDESVAAEQSLN